MINEGMFNCYSNAPIIIEVPAVNVSHWLFFSWDCSYNVLTKHSLTCYKHEHGPIISKRPILTKDIQNQWRLVGFPTFTSFIQKRQVMNSGRTKPNSPKHICNQSVPQSNIFTPVSRKDIIILYEYYILSYYWYK